MRYWRILTVSCPLMQRDRVPKLAVPVGRNVSVEVHETLAAMRRYAQDQDAEL